MGHNRWFVRTVINNNIVSARNARNQEYILTGKGIGFKVRPGEEVDAEKIEKEYYLKSKNVTGKLYALLANTPDVYLDITDEIVEYAQKLLGKELDEIIYLNLISHISFAVSRIQQGILFDNTLLWEIKSFYPKEFEAGKLGLALIREKAGEELPEDEAGTIAMHIVNAEFDYQGTNDSYKMTVLIHKIINVVRYQYKMNFDEDSVHFVRFVTHLKFFAQRLFQDKMLDSDDRGLQEMIRIQYPEAYGCAQKIIRIVWEDYQIAVPEEEVVYLAVYIHRITSQAND